LTNTCDSVAHLAVEAITVGSACLNGCKSLVGRAALSELVVHRLSFNDLLLQLFNDKGLHIVFLKTLLLHVRLTTVSLLNGNQTQLPQFMLLLLFKFVDFLKKHYIFFHEAALNVFGFSARLCHNGLKILYLLLQVVSVSELGASTVALFVFVFFKYVLLVKRYKSLLKFLVVLNLEQTFVDVLHKFLLVSFLLVGNQLEVLHLLHEAILSHSQVINNQLQVFVNASEMVDFLLHRVGLLLKLIQLFLAGTNVTLQLLDFVVKHKLKLLQLLGFLLKIVNSLILVTNSRITFRKFALLTLNVVF